MVEKAVTRSRSFFFFKNNSITFLFQSFAIHSLGSSDFKLKFRLRSQKLAVYPSDIY